MVFLATTEARACDDHKDREVRAEGGVSVLGDVFARNWPRGAAVRVITSSVTDAPEAAT
jgi:hypothetical protein